jgi:SAM-dependent methyltransferase
MSRERFTCPICGYHGTFLDLDRPSGVRRHAVCPQCNAFERHRVQFVVVKQVLERIRPSTLRLLHVAPEECLRKFLSERFGQYDTAGLQRPDVDHEVDLENLPFADRSYDFVFASHVLEHVRDDGKALSEIRRILRPDGIAVLPVPILAEKTVEYPEPNPHELHHVRAPGLDYLDKYDRYFSHVDKISSLSLPNEYQPFVYEDRTRWPTKECPLRPPMPGERHVEVVPVCYV